MSSRSGLRQRGSSSFTFARKSYALETWTELNEEPHEQSLLGLSPESDWVLYAPDSASNFDVPLIHNSLIYELARQSGFDAPRFRFVEVFLNTAGGDVTMADHKGLYLLVEKPKLSESPGRLAITSRYVLSPAIFECLDQTTPGKNDQQLQLGLEVERYLRKSLAIVGTHNQPMAIKQNEETIENRMTAY